MMKSGLQRMFLICSFTCFAVFAGCGTTSQGHTEPTPPVAKEKVLSLDEQAEELVDSMSLTEKVGQMVMIGVEGTEVNEDSLYMLHQFHMGGVVLFDRNMESPEQVGKLTEQLQHQAEEKLPLFIGVDEEGGLVVRMREQLPELPSQEAIGATGEPEQAKTWAATIAELVKRMGINTNFAPVADIGSSSGRSYSDDADTVSAFVQQASRGYEGARVFYSLKHFPGIGRAMVDPHMEVSDIDASLEELLETDLKPFQAIIGEHEPDRYFIMVSHLKYPQLDAQEPASLSQPIVTGLLRETLGYRGIIITDDLAMGAVANHNDFRELGVKAIQAGVDIAMICHEYEHQQEVYLGILDAVKNGVISEERINESVKRIVRTKLRYLK